MYGSSQESVSFVIQNASEEAALSLEVNKPGKDGEHRRRNYKKQCSCQLNWRNSNLHSGAAWIIREFSGEVVFHARDAMTCSPSWLLAELRCILWVLQSLRDLRFSTVIIASDHQDANEALSSPNAWPKYKGILEQTASITAGFVSVCFEDEKVTANLVATC